MTLYIPWWIVYIAGIVLAAIIAFLAFMGFEFLKTFKDGFWKY